MQAFLSVLAYGLCAYFALTLATAGISKLDDPGQFSLTLRAQKILPPWSIEWVQRIFPWYEVGLAVALVIAGDQFVAALLTCFTFAAFLGIRITLYVTKSDAGCGCTGSVAESAVDSASVSVALISVCATFLQLWLSAHAPTMNGYVRVIVALVICAGVVYFLGMIYARKFYEKDSSLLPPPNVKGLDLGTSAPAFNIRDDRGELLRLADFLGIPLSGLA